MVSERYLQDILLDRPRPMVTMADVAAGYLPPFPVTVYELGPIDIVVGILYPTGKFLAAKR